MFVYILVKVLHLKAVHMQHNRHRLLSIMEEWERGSLKSRGSYFFVYKSSGNVHFPMWHGQGKGEIHVAKQVKKETHLFMDLVKEKFKS